MAAVGTVLELLDSGDHVVAMDDLYGGTYRLFEAVRRRSARGNAYGPVPVHPSPELERALGLGPAPVPARGRRLRPRCGT